MSCLYNVHCLDHKWASDVQPYVRYDLSSCEERMRSVATQYRVAIEQGLRQKDMEETVAKLATAGFSESMDDDLIAGWSRTCKRETMRCIKQSEMRTNGSKTRKKSYTAMRKLLRRSRKICWINTRNSRGSNTQMKDEEQAMQAVWNKVAARHASR